AGARIVDSTADRERVEAWGDGLTYVSLEELAARLGDNFLLHLRSPCETTPDIVRLFSTRATLTEMTAEDLIGKRVVNDLLEAKGEKVLLKAFGKIDKTVAANIVKQGLPSLEVFVVNRYIEATLDQDPTHSKEEALLDIYRKIRPGDPATADSSRNLINSI